MSAFAAMTLPVPPLETFLERVPARELNVCLDVWKGMRRRGWDVTALVSPDGVTVVVLGCRGGPTRPVERRRRADDSTLAAIRQARDEIAARGGLTVRFNQPLPPHAQALMRTLGVTTEDGAA